jgi:uncharacterized membrane protein (DUF2068 family)
MTELPPRTAGLYGIIFYKLIKGVLFLALGLGIYTLTDNNLPEDFRNIVQQLHMDPENEWFQELEQQLAKVTPGQLIKLASGSLLYSLPSLIETVGLFYRWSWAGWLAIVESSFFIPIEIYELGHHFNVVLLVLTIINVAIVWYLYRNRERLFPHHRSQGEVSATRAA